MIIDISYLLDRPYTDIHNQPKMRLALLKMCGDYAMTHIGISKCQIAKEIAAAQTYADTFNDDLKVSSRQTGTDQEMPWPRKRTGNEVIDATLR